MERLVMWGVFELDDSIHICPCDQDGYLRQPHETDEFCVCDPECIEIGEDGRLIINHNEVN